jgi:hypothetical protein
VGPGMTDRSIANGFPVSPSIPEIWISFELKGIEHAVKCTYVYFDVEQAIVNFVWAQRVIE